MAARRKRRTRRRLRLRTLPGWGLLVMGLAVGILLAVLVQLVVDRARSPGSGLNTLLTRSEGPRPTPAQPPTPAAAPKQRPKYDFYTILPEIETVLPDQDAPPPGKTARAAAPDPSARYVLQAGSFARFEDADRLKAQLALNGLFAQIQKVSIEGRGEYHRVRLGPYASLRELDGADQQLRALGIQALRLKIRPEA